ncbi:MAG: formate dehydrogenase accessory sulfurtransferase FdhD [Methanofollis sp.]|uniref:formate dehydrogenase accessory sulfurtransferase FdhD n=1 Tax=Methanofollis sp. TaxID=2052835 RepID=UPI0026182B27|nr:formate dehydrogenase accessory sulfurtransferase FdhD [Methanofollis sp.]MDD4255709.1 formate dehydrogenase accessory sulfurtransferase FdhD [Methanofollis sp.]
MFRKIPCIRFDGEGFETIAHDVVEELPVALFVNGRHAMTAMMSPGNFEDFVVGYLFTEEIIKGPEEIESIKVEKNRVSVLTTNPFKSIGTKKTILSGCGGSVSYIDTEKLPKVRSDLTVTPAEILGAVQSVLTSELHTATGGVHIVALLDREKVIAVAEDIGRHNALDRVIGYGLRNGVDFSLTYVVSSGRISSEMVRKCLVANIPLIVSRGATTSLAVETAEKTGLTVVGFARGGKLNIYSHPDRVEGADQKTE